MTYIRKCLVRPCLSRSTQMSSLCRFTCRRQTEWTPLQASCSKKVVLRKSKIQITKYKIEQKVCHITNMNGPLTSIPWHTLYEEVFSVKWSISKRNVYIWSLSQSILILYFVFWNLDFVFSRDNLFWISCMYNTRLNLTFLCCTVMQLFVYLYK